MPGRLEVCMAVVLASAGWHALARPAAAAGQQATDNSAPVATLPDLASASRVLYSSEAPVQGQEVQPVPAEDTEVQEKGGKGKPEKKDSEATSEKGADNAFTIQLNWKDGLVGATSDEAFRIHVGGRLDWDSGWYAAPASLDGSLNTPLRDGTDLRRFRFETDGTIWQQVDFQLEADFSKAADFKMFQSTPQTNVFITDAWLAVHDLPVVDTVRAGHQKEYLTFSNAISSKFAPFMERPYLFDAFEDDYSFGNGISMNRTYFDERATSWLGVFWNGTRSQAFNVGGHYAVSGRLTWLPLYNEDQQQWVNVGVSGSLQAFGPQDPNRVTVRPLVRTGESFQVPNLIDTGAILGQNGLQMLGAGLHSAWGPLTVGGEFLCRFIDHAFTGGYPLPDGTLPPGTKAVGDLFFSGFSVEALYFLTRGDHQPINRVIPGYDRVSPVENFSFVRDGSGCCRRGPGAWEVGIRYDRVDVNSGLIQAGTLDSVTLGLNWYLNPNARVMTNYVYTFRDMGAAPGTGSFSALGVRVHFDF